MTDLKELEDRVNALLEMIIKLHDASTYLLELTSILNERITMVSNRVKSLEYTSEEITKH